MNKEILINYLNSLEECGIPGCDCAVYYNHKPVFRHMMGYADIVSKKPLAQTNTYWLYSATKLFTCTAVMQLIEQGRIGLDTPVSEYLPEFMTMKVKEGSGVRPAKKPITVRHLLSMQSGLNYNLDAPSILKILGASEYEATTRQVVAALANEPLDFEPGTRFQYSLSHDVLGAVIEVVSGQQLGKYFEEHLFNPLGMKNTGFELTLERKANLAGQFEYHMESKTSTSVPNKNRYALTRNFQSAGAGLISTVDDYILFLDAMCNEGVSADGYRVLSMDSINLMRKDQLKGESKKDFDAWCRYGYSYALGVRTLIERQSSGARSPLGEFGWDGAAGAFALIDTENHLALFYAQHVLNCGYAYNVIHPKVRNLTYEMMGL
ncbi:MAG: beta-lactamase family protein [Thermoclostridium sp.]|nr:beta-lactamase family protein [Thermoclostridium sp.]